MYNSLTLIILTIRLFLTCVHVLLQDLLRSELPDAIEKALKGDERYVNKLHFIECTINNIDGID